MINIIACITYFKNKLAIGKNGGLLFKLKDDMAFFKNITTNQLSQDSKLNKNVVLMGRKTFFSIPQNFRPLKDRINIVLTRDKQLMNLSPVPSNLDLSKDLYFTDMLTFNKIYEKYNPNVYVIGGADVYNHFMNKSDRLYITHVQTEDNKDIKFEKNEEPDTFINHFSADYKLVGLSEKYKGVYNNIPLSYRVLHYRHTDKTTEEYKYMHLMNNIIMNGNWRSDRTGVGTVSVFGNQMRFDISQSIPMMTTKRVPFKTILEELLWFCRGDTDAKLLQSKGVKIWDGNTSREFLDKQGLTHYPEGVLGAGYGFQWRFFGAKYSHSFADTSQVDTSLIGGVDQLQYVEDLLKNDPFSRRIMISAWNPSDFDKTALVPCHVLLQFYVEEINGEKYLSSQFYMRSNDVFLANVFNVVSYSVLTYILAKRTGMKPKEIVYTCGDSHIYSNHVEQVKEQLERHPRPFPKLVLDESVATKDWSKITAEDFELVGYFPYPAIKAPMAV